MTRISSPSTLHRKRQLIAAIAAVALPLLVTVASQSAAAQERTTRGDNRPSRNNRDRSDNSEQRLDTTVTVEKGAILDLSASDGKITVRGWNRSEIEVHAVSEAGSLSFSKSARAVRVEARRGERNRSGDVTMQVRVPLNTRVVVNTMLGDVQVLDVHGELDADLMTGDITVRGSSGRTAITNVSGEIVVSDVDGPLSVSAISGGMTLNDVRGNVEVSSSSGDVSMRGIQSSAVKVEVVEGEIFFDGAMSATGKYEFQTHSGDVHLYLAENAKGTVLLQSFNGTLHSAIPLMLKADSAAQRSIIPRSFAQSGRSGSGRGMTLNEQQRLDFGGGGGALVSVTTFNGDVHISRGPRREEKDK